MLKVGNGGTTQSGSSSEVVTKAADGTTSTQSTATRNTTTAPGSAASVPDADFAQLPDGTVPTTAPISGHNPILRYQLASALLQEVNLLNAYVGDAPQLSGYDRFIVRMQITVRPAARYTPFDAVEELQFSCGDPCGGDVVVVPLLVNDNLDASSVSSLQRNIAQLGLALGALQGTFGFLGDIGAQSQEVVRALGWQYQSIFNVTTKGRDTLSVRINAQPSGYGHFDLIPRTHGVTALLLVKRPNSTDWRSKMCVSLAGRPCALVKLTSNESFVHSIQGTSILGGKTGIDRTFQVNFWPDPTLPAAEQDTALMLSGKKPSFSATMTLRGGTNLTKDTFASATMKIGTHTLITDSIEVDDGRRNLVLHFSGLGEDMKNLLAGQTNVRLTLRAGPDICSASSSALSGKCEEGYGITVYLQVMAPEESEPQALTKMVTPPQLIVDRFGKAVLPLNITLPTKGVMVSKVEISFDKGVPGLPQNFNGTSGCASISGGKVVVTGTCNFDVPLRGVPIPNTCCGVAPIELRATFKEFQVAGKTAAKDKVAKDPVIGPTSTLALVAGSDVNDRERRHH